MGLITALGPLAIDMYLPAFAAIAEDLGTSHGRVEQTLASYLFGLSLAQLAYGPLADRFGRRSTLLAGLSIFILGSLGASLTHDIDHLALWRIVQAFGGAAGIVVPRAVIRDNFDTRDASKALSVLMLVMGATPILAPILGGQILIFASWRWIFYLMTLLAASLLLSAVLTMQETLAPEHVSSLHPRYILKNYVGLFGDKSFIFFALAGGFGSAGMFSYIVGSPRVFINTYGVDPRYFGFLFGANAAAFIAMAQVSARLLNRSSPETIFQRALNSLAIATVIALLLTLFNVLNLTALMLCLILYMGSQGFVNPNAAALALRHQGHRLGTASALMGTLQMLAESTAGLLISLWQTPGPLPLVGLLCACAILSWLCGRLAMKTV